MIIMSSTPLEGQAKICVPGFLNSSTHVLYESKEKHRLPDVKYFGTIFSYHTPLYETICPDLECRLKVTISFGFYDLIQRQVSCNSGCCNLKPLMNIIVPIQNKFKSFPCFCSSHIDVILRSSKTEQFDSFVGV